MLAVHEADDVGVGRWHLLPRHLEMVELREAAPHRLGHMEVIHYLLGCCATVDEGTMGAPTESR